MSRRLIGLALAGATSLLLAGCGSNFFGDPAPSETSTDAERRANDPYHTNPLYNPNVPASAPYRNEMDPNNKIEERRVGKECRP